MQATPPEASTQASAFIDALAQNPAEHDSAFGSGSTVGFAPSSEPVKRFGTGAVEQDGVIKTTGDVGGEGHVGLAGEGVFEVFGNHFGAQLHLNDGPKTLAQHCHIDQSPVSGQDPFALQAFYPFTHRSGTQMDLFAQFTPTNSAVQLQGGDDSTVKLI